MLRAFSDLMKKPILRVTNQKNLSIKDSGYFTEQSLAIDTKSNPTAYKILTSKTLDPLDKDLSVSTIDLTSMKAYTLDSSFVQSNLGEIKVYRADQILLEDVDPNNIPHDKEIVIFPNKARLQAIGKPSERENNRIDQEIFSETKENLNTKLTWRHYLWLLPLSPLIYFILVYIQVYREYKYVNSFYRAIDQENQELLDCLKTLPTTIPQQTQLLSKIYPD